VPDALSSWLKTAATSTVQVSWTRVASPWGVQIDPKEDLALHIVLEGSCWLARPDAQPLQLLQGDLVVANCVAHDLVHEPGQPAVPLNEFRKRPPPPTGVGTTAIVCASYRSDVHITRQMLRVLPPVMHLPASQARSIPHLAAVIDLATAEIVEPGPGRELLITYLFDALFLYLLRAWLKVSKLEVGWLAALQDRCVSRTLARMHADPARPWTVDDLAAEAGISRATFSRRFSKRMGEAPLSYLTRWRMSLAMQMLAETRAPLATLARNVGYDSEFAFSRAFKRYYGAAPSFFRQSSAREPATVELLLPTQLV
jgi:AraC-like DNA-binding protein